MYFIIDAGF